MEKIQQRKRIESAGPIGVGECDCLYRMVREGVPDKIACRADKAARRTCAHWYTRAKAPRQKPIL